MIELFEKVSGFAYSKSKHTSFYDVAHFSLILIKVSR